MRKTVEQFEFKIFIAGDYHRACAICEDFCLQGFCVTVLKTEYIYTMGRESGVEVGIINYARFPKDIEDAKEMVFQLADRLLIGLNQGSYSVTGGGESIFFSRRGDE